MTGMDLLDILELFHFWNSINGSFRLFSLKPSDFNVFTVFYFLNCSTTEVTRLKWWLIIIITQQVFYQYVTCEFPSRAPSVLAPSVLLAVECRFTWVSEFPLEWPAQSAGSLEEDWYSLLNYVRVFQTEKIFRFRANTVLVSHHSTPLALHRQELNLGHFLENEREWRIYGKAEELTGDSSEKAFCEGLLAFFWGPRSLETPFWGQGPLGKHSVESLQLTKAILTPSFSSQWQKLLISHDPLFSLSAYAASDSFLTPYSRMSPIEQTELSTVPGRSLGIVLLHTIASFDLLHNSEMDVPIPSYRWNLSNLSGHIINSKIGIFSSTLLVFSEDYMPYRSPSLGDVNLTNG